MIQIALPEAKITDLWRNSHASVDFPPVRDSMESEHLGLMVDPQEDSIVPNPVLVNPRQVGGCASKGLRNHLWMRGKLVNLPHDPATDGRVELAEISFETGGRFDAVKVPHVRQNIWRGVWFVKRNSDEADGDGALEK